jgi:hypothetical protein
MLHTESERMQVTVAEQGMVQPERVDDNADCAFSGAAEARSVMGVVSRLVTKVWSVCRFGLKSAAKELVVAPGNDRGVV